MEKKDDDGGMEVAKKNYYFIGRRSLKSERKTCSWAGWDAICLQDETPLILQWNKKRKNLGLKDNEEKRRF